MLVASVVVALKSHIFLLLFLSEYLRLGVTDYLRILFVSFFSFYGSKTWPRIIDEGSMTTSYWIVEFMTNNLEYPILVGGSK